MRRIEMLRKLSLIGLSMAISLGALGNDQSWDENNNPDLFGENLEVNLRKLPVQGNLDKMPWSGDYWPTYKGGITYRWNQPVEGEDQTSRYAYRMLDMNFLEMDEIKNYSPAEKYDIFLGASEFPLTSYERKRTKILKTVKGTLEFDEKFEIPKWEGLCHAWAPATIMFDNPAPVTLKNDFGIEVQFGSSDIKALLTYFLHSVNSKTNFMGTRCNLSFKDLEKEFKEGKITEEEFLEKIESSECYDTHPAAFHIALANQIGIKKEGFILDMTRDSEVWNQAVYGYQTYYYKKNGPISEDAPENTDKEIIADTNVYIIVEVPQSWEKEINDKSIKRLQYRYSLALDKDDNIIGGKWISKERPDFIWKRELPKFSGFFKPLENIYNQSVKKLSKERMEEIKKKISKLGRSELINKKFLEELNKKKAIAKFKRVSKNITNADNFINEVARVVMERKIRLDQLKKKLKSGVKSEILKKKFLEEIERLKRMKDLRDGLKKEAKAQAHASLFVNAVKKEVKLTKVKEALKKEGRKEILKKTFISELKKKKAITALKEEAKKDLMKKDVVSAFKSEVKKAKALEELKKIPNAKKFIDLTKKVVRINKLKNEATRTGLAAIAAAELKKKEEETRTQRYLNRHFLDAVKYGDLSKIKDLVDRGAELDFKNNLGENALIIASSKANKEVIEYLLSHKIINDLINSVDKNGQTALIRLVLNEEVESKDKAFIAEILYSKGIDLNKADNSGKTAHRYSRDRGYFKEYTLNRFFKKYKAKK